MKKTLIVFLFLTLVTVCTIPQAYGQSKGGTPKPKTAPMHNNGDGENDYATLEAEATKASVAEKKATAARIATPVNILKRIQAMSRDSKLEKMRTLDVATQNFRDIENLLQDNLSSRDTQTVACSMYLAGAYHLTNLIGRLAGDIAFKDDNSYQSPKANYPSAIWLWGQYPAADALVTLGFPSVPYLMANLENEHMEKTSKMLSLWVLVRISGPEDKELAQFLIKREMNRTDERKLNAAQLKNLAAALLSLNKNEQEIYD